MFLVQSLRWVCRRIQRVLCSTRPRSSGHTCVCVCSVIWDAVFCSFHLQWFSDNVSVVVIIRAQQIHLIYISNQAWTYFLLHSFSIYPLNAIQNVPLPHNTWTWWQDVCDRMLLVTIDFPTRQTQVLPFPLICFLYSWQFWKRLNKIDHFMKTILNSPVDNKLLKWTKIV